MERESAPVETANENQPLTDEEKVILDMTGQLVGGQNIEESIETIRETLDRAEQKYEYKNINPQLIFKSLKDLAGLSPFDLPPDARTFFEQIKIKLIDFYNDGAAFQKYYDFEFSIFCEDQLLAIKNKPVELIKILELMRVFGVRSAGRGFFESFDTHKLAIEIRDDTNNYLVKFLADDVSADISISVAATEGDLPLSYEQTQEGHILIENQKRFARSVLLAKYSKGDPTAWFTGRPVDQAGFTREFKKVSADLDHKFPVLHRDWMEQKNQEIAQTDCWGYPEGHPLRDFILDGYYAIDLSPDLIAVYDHEGALKKAVKKQELKPGEMPRLYDISDLDILVPGKSDEAAKLSRYKDFSILASLPFRRKIQKDFDIDLGSIDIRVQQYFINYLKDKNIQDVKYLQSYAKEFGLDFFTTFLALEEDANAGETILAICKNQPEVIGRQIFGKYRELFNAAQQVRTYLQENFSEQLANKPNLEDAIVDGLLKKANDLLRWAAQNDNQIIDIKAYLDGYKAEVQLFANAFKAIRDQNIPAELEYFKGVHLEKTAGGDLKPEIKQQLAALSDANWQDQGELGQKVSEGFRGLLNDPKKLKNTTFYLVMHNKDVLGFFRLDREPDGSLYFGSVNARGALAGAKIGETMLDTLFERATRGKRVTAHCSPDAPITAKYIGKYGFYATELANHAPGEKEPIYGFTIEKPAQSPPFELKGKNYQELAAWAAANRDHPAARVWRYSFPLEYNTMIAEISGLLESRPKKVITAYQMERKSRGEPYEVLVGIEELKPVKEPPPAAIKLQTALAGV